MLENDFAIASFTLPSHIDFQSSVWIEWNAPFPPTNQLAKHFDICSATEQAIDQQKNPSRTDFDQGQRAMDIMGVLWQRMAEKGHHMGQSVIG